MTNVHAAPITELIRVDLINVVNPRVRNQKIFKEIVENISTLGLKRPITVARRHQPDGPRYDLVCGQGRLEAYQALGQQLIPAVVIDADGSDCLVMSLVENLARRQHRGIDLLHDIEGLKCRGYTIAEIARKTGLTSEYARAVIRLLGKGEHRLLRAMEAGNIPVSVAIEIAQTDDAGIQQVLQQAYEKNLLRGQKLLAVKRLLEQRRRIGKKLPNTGLRKEKALSLNGLLRTYRADTEKKRLLVRKAETARDRLLFATEALRQLLADVNFVTLLRAEGLDTLPRNLGDRLRTGNRT